MYNLKKAVSITAPALSQIPVPALMAGAGQVVSAQFVILVIIKEDFVSRLSNVNVVQVGVETTVRSPFAR